MIEVAEPDAVPLQEISPVAVPVIWIEPSVPEHELGAVTVPRAITGVVFTVTLVAAEEEVHPATSTSTL